MKSRNCSLNCFYSRNLLRLKRKLEVKEDKKSSLEREKYKKKQMRDINVVNDGQNN